MKPPSLNLKYILGAVLFSISTFCMISEAPAPPLPSGFTPREMFSRGAIKGQEYRRRSRLRQLRIQESRMPQDVRSMVVTPLERPGEVRPEIIDSLSRDNTQFIAGGWMWNSGAVPLYAGVTGPSKGFSDPQGGIVEYAGTDPEGLAITKETPITEWWEFSAREKRAEFFRSRFGAAQQMQAVPGVSESSMGRTGQTEFTPPSGGMTPGGTSAPGGGF